MGSSNWIKSVKLGAVAAVASLGLMQSAHAGNDAVFGAVIGAGAGSMIGGQIGGRDGAIVVLGFKMKFIYQ